MDRAARDADNHAGKPRMTSAHTGSPTDQDPLQGLVLKGLYRVVERLGEGSMGAVYLATSERDGSKVAIKVLRPELVDPERRERLIRRFERETVATLSLDHPNIVKVLDFGRESFGMFLVLEHLQGYELRDVLKETRVLEADRVAKIAFQIALALVDAHASGIVHRDLKPENIFVVPEPEDPDIVKVVDFGIARMPENTEEATQVTKAGVPLGTPRYMSPEQAQAREVTFATDLYSLGVMIFEMLTGDAPFVGPTDMMTAIMHINEKPPQLVIPGMPEGEDLERWRDLVGRLLAKSPAQRPGSAQEVVRLIEPLLPDTRTGASGLRRRPSGAYARGLRHSQTRIPIVRPGGSGVFLRPGQSGAHPRPSDADPLPPVGGGTNIWVWIAICAGIVAVATLVAVLVSLGD